MKANEVNITKIVLKHEGGYTNEAADPGGPTKYGITIWDARKYWRPKATADDVKAMPLDVAIDIYDKHYWDPLRCDDLPSGVDYVVYDYGINSGIARPPLVLQRMFGLTETKMMGEITLDRVRKTDPHKVIDAICDERMHFLQGLKNWPTYKNGWTTRVSDVRRISHSLVGKTDAITPEATITKVETPKGTHVDPNLPKKIGTTGVASSGITGVGSHLLASDAFFTALVAGTVAVVVVGVGIFVYYRQKKNQSGVILPATAAIRSITGITN